jgi:hypothetical protein
MVRGARLGPLGAAAAAAGYIMGPSDAGETAAELEALKEKRRLPSHGYPTVSLFRLAPHALPDAFSVAVLVGTVVAPMAWRIGAFKLTSLVPYSA